MTKNPRRKKARIMPSDIAQDIIGTWTLSDFQIYAQDHTARQWGENIRGLLIYTACGHISVSITRDIEGSSSNPADVLESLLFYAGRYTVLETGMIQHYVDIASNPDRVGRTMDRFAELEDETLTLTTPIESYGQAKLTWIRSKA